jgi:O-antigen chain-terminating methyltransferase
VSRLRELPQRLANLEKQNKELLDYIGKVNHELKLLSNHMNIYIGEKDDQIKKIDRKISDIQHQQLISDNTPHEIRHENNSANNLLADNHKCDYFYEKFEECFRGSEKEIEHRLLAYLPMFNKLPKKLKGLKIVDIGSGRGEMLSLLKKKGFTAIGVDINKNMVKRAKERGLDVINQDALSFLLKQKDSGFAAIVGFQIVEHIPFESLLCIFNECYRTIADGGFAIFETPDPETLCVGANTFYLDPSHQRPIPSGLLEFALKYAGFKTKIIRSNRLKPSLGQKENRHIKEIYDTLYGSADYAVIARKLP